MLPGVEILTPIRDLRLSREAEIAFLKENGVEMNTEKAKYSINKGLWGTSVGGKGKRVDFERLPARRGLADTFSSRKKDTRRLELVFEKGELRAVDGQSFPNPVEAIQHLQAIAQPLWRGQGYPCRRHDHRDKRPRGV